MNIEQLLPWLNQSTSTSTTTAVNPKIYTCQRCINHGVTVPRKNHKWKCAFAECVCDSCALVEKRRLLNAELARANSMESESSTSSPPVLPVMTAKSPTGNKERLPHCQRCAQHNVTNRLKGHKRLCPFRDCPCIKCQVVVERQRLMADQIKLRRRQKKQKSGLGILKTSDTSLPTTPTMLNFAQNSPDAPPSGSTSPGSSSDYSINALINPQNLEPTKFSTPNGIPIPFPLPYLNGMMPMMPMAPIPPMASMVPGPMDWQFAFALCQFQQNQQAAAKKAQ